MASSSQKLLELAAALRELKTESKESAESLGLLIQKLETFAGKDITTGAKGLTQELNVLQQAMNLFRERGLDANRDILHSFNAVIAKAREFEAANQRSLDGLRKAQQTARSGFTGGFGGLPAAIRRQSEIPFETIGKAKIVRGTAEDVAKLLQH